MKLSKKEKKEIKDGNMYLSVDVGWFTYPEHMDLQKRLRRFKIICNTVPGGTAIHPKTAAQVRKTKRICRRIGATLNRGETYRMRF